MTLIREQERAASGQTAMHAPLASSKAHFAAQGLVLATLFLFPVFLCAHSTTANDPDVWWHLRAGEWIAQHGAVPRLEPFTGFAAGKPWIAYSWLFEWLIYQLYHGLGLSGLIVYTASMTAAVTIALYCLIRRLQPDFVTGVVLTLAASLCTARMWTPRPWLFTMLFFVVELGILIEARRGGARRAIWILPAIFALWANVHIQFIDGLVVLGIAVADAAWVWQQERVPARSQFLRMGAVFMTCGAATLANPYGWRVYKEAYELVSQKSVLNVVGEMQAMAFRNPLDYGVLFFCLAATAALARAPRRRLFEILLLIFAVLVSFRSQRDAWIGITVSAAILADAIHRDTETQASVRAYAVPVAIVVTLAAAPFLYRAAYQGNRQLRAKLADDYPVQAVNFVKENGLAGPLFNGYNWGGYLIWDLRMPVSIDGRAALDGDKLLDRNIATWTGAPEWACDPDLRKANLVIGPVHDPLVQLLSLTSDFRLAYKDKTAAVFVARRQQAPAGVPAGCIR